MAKPKPKRRTRKPGAETDCEIARDELRSHGPRARWALDTLEQMARGESTYGALPPALVIVCIKEILAYEGLPKALQFKAAEGVTGDTTITIQVANWAAASPMPRALPEPAETIIEASAPHNNSTPPAPTMSDRERLRRQVAAQRETVIVEAPPGPAEQARVVGRMSQSQPYQLSLDEKQRIMETLQRGPQK
jgi:hypothetical protein